MASTHLGVTGQTYYAKLVGSSVSPWSTGIVVFVESSQLGVFAAATDDTLSYVVYLQAGGSPASSDSIDALVPGASPPPSFYQAAPIVRRSTDDTDEIRFAWPVTGATITGQVSKGGAAFGAVAGAISFLRTEAGTHIYQIAYNAADRQEGSVRYLFTDGTYTRAVNLEVFGAVSGGGATAEEVADEIANRGITMIAVQSGVTNATTLELIQGDTYDGIGKPLLGFTVAVDYTSGWAATLTIRDKKDVVIVSYVGVVATATSITFNATAPTGLVMEGCPGSFVGKWDLQLSKAGSIATIARGVAYVYEDQTR